MQMLLEFTKIVNNGVGIIPVELSGEEWEFIDESDIHMFGLYQSYLST